MMPAYFYDEWDCPHHWEDIGYSENETLQLCGNCGSTQEIEDEDEEEDQEEGE